MSITVEEFLRRKGAIGLLSLLHERPMTYSEIEPEIEVTSSTIVERRDDAADLGLIDVSLGRGEVGTKKVYTLTDMGEYLTDKMAREGIISNYRKMRALQQLLDDQTDDIVTWVQENPSQLLQFEDAIDGTILKGDELAGNSSSERESESGAESSPSSTDGEGAPAADKYPSNMDDTEIDPPERPREREDSATEDASPVEMGSSDGTGSEMGDETESDGDTPLDDSPSRSVPPSERSSIFDETPDAEDLKQGTFEDMSRDEEPTEKGEDTGTEKES